MNKPYPNKISPTPIVSAAIEIKFDISCPFDAVFGLVYPLLSKNYLLNETLPIVHIPEQIRVQDGLIEYPHYRFFNEASPYSLLVGPKIFVFVYNKENLEDTNDYPGWSEFIKQELLRLYKILFSLGFIDKVTRLGIRYNDFFVNKNIFEYTEFNLVDSNGTRKDLEQMQVIQTVKKESVINNIVVSNNSSFITKNNNTQGSMIDIDSYMLEFESDFVIDFEKFLQQCHETNKELFFEMIKKEFVNTLNPIYGES